MVASHAHRNRWIWAALAALLVALMMTTAAADASGRRGDPGVRSHSGCRSYARPVYRAPRFNCSSRSS